MKNKVVISAIAVAMLLASVFAGCSPSDSPSSVPASTSSQTESVVSQGSSEVSTPSKASEEKFEAYFKKNPIDQAHTEAQTTAYSNADIVKVENQFSEIWQKEIDSCYEKLLTIASKEDQAAIEQAQTKWSAEKQSKLDEISQDAQQNGGTMASVQTATNTMNFYRDRAKELYRSLYNYDQSYGYVYQADMDMNGAKG